jgi:hypothetical protein
VNPVRRLMLAGAGVIAGGAVIAIGTRLTWATVTVRGAPVTAPGLPRIILAGGRLTFDASSVGGGYLFGLGLLLALVPLGWLVTGPRGRTILAVIAAVLAAGVFVGTFQTRAGTPRHVIRILANDVSAPAGTVFHVSTGPGVPITGAGAALAALGAVWGLTVGGRAPRLGLPEEPPDRPDLNGHR